MTCVAFGIGFADVFFIVLLLACVKGGSMIIATLRIFADSGNISEIIEVLLSIKGQTEGKTGCVSCVIHQEVNNENRITYEERWENQEQLYNHIRSDLYRKILAVIDMSIQPPAVKFDTLLSTSGMEMIKTALGYSE